MLTSRLLLPAMLLLMLSPLGIEVRGDDGTMLSLQSAEQRPRAREIGIVIGVIPPGPLNAITDVAGVRVGRSSKVTRSEPA
jgi:hypothetical protein